MEKKTTKNSWLVYIVLPLTSVLLTFCAVELLMSVFRPVPYSLEVNGLYESDPYTGDRVKPNYSGVYPSGIPARFNSLGLNDEERTYNKKAGTFRILVLGDSFTAGSNLYREQVYPFLLEKLLNKTCKIPIEVINAGVDGWDPFQYAQYYEHYGRKFEHDMVLVGLYIGNDIYEAFSDVSQFPNIVLGRRVFAKNTIFTKLKIIFYKNSHITRLLMNTSPPIANFTRKNCDDIDEFSLWFNKIFLKNYQKSEAEAYPDVKFAVNQIQRIKNLADKTSIPVVVVMLPDEKQVNPTLQKKIIPESKHKAYNFFMPQSMLQKMFDEIGVKSIDLLPIFLKSTDCLYQNDTHFSPAGQSLTAATIAHEISGIVKLCANLVDLQTAQ
jgi:lysophospholipase L1-like esterase